jgi:hypothetical protein
MEDIVPSWTKQFYDIFNFYPYFVPKARLEKTELLPHKLKFQI